MSTDESPDAMVSYLMARVESLKLDCRAAHSEVGRLKGELGKTRGSAAGPSDATPTRTPVSTPEPVAKTPDATEESKEAIEEDSDDSDDFLSEEALANVLAAARDVSAALLLPAGSRPDLDVNGRDLLQSVRQGLCNRLRRLVGEEPLALENRSLSSQKTFGFTLLHIAAAEGQLKACETLLDLGADPNATDLMGRTALHIAANKLHKDVVVLLMSRMNGDVTGKCAPQDAGGITPAGYAAMGEKSKAERKELLHLLHRPGDACISPWQSRSASRLKGRSTRKSKLGSSRKGLHTPMVFRKLNETKSAALPIQFGSSSIPGYRVSMEDAVLLSDSVGPSGQIALFVVFDGHGGKRAPDYLVSNFTSVFEATNEVSSGAAALDREAMTSALKNACITIDANMSQEAAFVMRETVIQEAMGDDPAVLGKTASEKSGSTAIILAVARDFAAIGNIGDSRALVLENNKLTFATRDQRKPRQLENTHPSEKEIAEYTEAAQFFAEELKRIEAAGGKADPVYGRVQFNPKSEASVAMTRCLGDFDFKQNTGNPLTEVLIPVPEVYIIERKPDCDITVLLASDGIWDIMSNTMCEKALLNALPQTLDKAEMGHNSDLDMVSHTIASSCIDSFDNLSVVIVKMPPKSTVDASAPPDAPSDEGDSVQKNLLSVLEQEAGSIQPPAENSRKNEVSLAMGLI